MPLGRDHVQATQLLHAGAEQNVGATTSHVGGNRNASTLACLLDDGGFLPFASGIEDRALEAELAQLLREHFTRSNAASADEDRASGFVHANHFLDHR